LATTSLSADPNYRYSINHFPGDGERTLWDINFAGGFIKRDHVKAVVTTPNDIKTSVEIIWLSDATIQITPPVPFRHILTVYRETPKNTPIANFHDGAVVNEQNLDDNAKQAVFIAAEAIDRGEGALNELGPRAILVPAGEVAPGFNIRDFRGKTVGVDFDGNFTPVTQGSGGGGGLGEVGSGMVLHGGQTLSSILTQRIAEIELTTGQLEDIAYTITAQGEAAIAQALSTTALDAALATLRTDHTALSGTVTALSLIADQNTEGLFTVIETETSQRIAGDTAMAATISLIGAKNGANNAFILNLDTVKVGPDESLLQRFNQLTATAGANTAAIQAETTARANALTAEATQRTSLAATLRGEISSAIQTEQTARSDAVSAEATKRTTLAATLRGEAATGLVNEAINRNTAITAAVTAESNARATAIAAEATARSGLATTLRGETTAAIQAESTARSTAIGSETTARTTMGSTLQGNINSQIQTEQNTRAAADAVFTQNFTFLGARNPGGTAFILDESKVMLSGGNSVGTRLTGITTSVSNVNARVAAEETARANAVSAVASRATTLEATAGSLTSRIATEETVRATAVGNLEAKVGVTLNVNGHITGFQQNNNGQSGDFIVAANTFKVAQPGIGGVSPFDDNGLLKGTIITPGSVTTDKLSVSSLSAISATIGTLRTATTGARTELRDNVIKVFDAGNVLRVQIGDLSL
jgi:tRNA threonylcarbamoyladenosine modification (KEOPS) complex Cgi121 subunit